MTERPLALAERVSRLAVWGGGLALIAVAFLVTLEVILRKVFLVGLSVATELSAYTLAIGTAWGYAFALFQRNHVRVDALVRLLPARLLIWVDLLALAVLIWFAALLVWHGSGVLNASLARSSRAMTPLATPLWIPQGLWVLGLASFLVACIVLFARAVHLVVAGRPREASALIGTFSREDEAADEATQAAARQRQVPRA